MSTLEQRSVIIPSIISLGLSPRRNLLHYFSLGEIVDGTLFAETGTELFNIELHASDDPAALLRPDSREFSTFYRVNSSQVYYERRYGGIKCALLVDGMGTGRMKIYANPTYLRTVRFKLDSLYPVGVHLTDLLLLNIIAHGDLVVHGASLQHPGTSKGFLMVAPPDTGKTYTTYKLLEQGYKFLGEDLSYYRASSDEIICMPYTSTWGHRFRLSKFETSKIPFFGLFFSERKKGVGDIFGQSAICEKAPLEQIYLLQKSAAKRVSRIGPSPELVRKVMAIQRNEFSYYKNPLIRAFEYYNDIDVDEVFRQERAGFQRLLSEKDLFLVEAPNYTDFESMIIEHSSS